MLFLTPLSNSLFLLFFLLLSPQNLSICLLPLSQSSRTLLRFLLACHGLLLSLEAILFTLISPGHDGTAAPSDLRKSPNVFDRRQLKSKSSAEFDRRNCRNFTGQKEPSSDPQTMVAFENMVGRASFNPVFDPSHRTYLLSPEAH